MAGEDCDWDASQPGRKQADRRPLEEVRVNDVDALAPEQKRQADRCTRILGAPHGPQRVLSEPHPLGVGMKRPGCTHRGESHVEPLAVCVRPDRPEIRIGPRLGDDVQDPDRMIRRGLSSTMNPRRDSPRLCQQSCERRTRLMCGICGLVTSDAGDVRPVGGVRRRT
jgi:hypothetical protein